MKLIVGLGNPGSRYLKTRHNAGFILLDRLAEEAGVSFDQKMFDAVYAETDYFEERAVLLKPQTFMNLSGKSVRKWQQFYKISSKDLIVIHDDIDIAGGAVKMKTTGGHAGNNGIKSIIEETGSPDFFRIRLGIGKPQVSQGPTKEGEITNWVLGAFTDEQLAELNDKMFKETMLRLQEIFRQNKHKDPKGDVHA